MTDHDPPASATETTVSPSASSPLDLIVVGGGPAGYMAAITAAEQGVRHVLVLEGTSEPLQKVRIEVTNIFLGAARMRTVIRGETARSLPDFGCFRCLG